MAVDQVSTLFPVLRDALRAAGPDFHTMVLILTVAVEILPAELALLICPEHDAVVAAVCNVIGMESAGRFQCNNYVPDPPGGVVYPEDHITWTNLRQVFQLAARIGLVSEDTGAEHAGVASATVGAVGVVAPHELRGLGAGDSVFAGVRVELWIIPRDPGRPPHLQLVQDFQYILILTISPS